MVALRLACLLAASLFASSPALSPARHASGSGSHPAAAKPRVALRRSSPNATVAVAAAALSRDVGHAGHNATAPLQVDGVAPCAAGDAVYALYAGDGVYYSATIRHIDGNGAATVDWYNEDPWHRKMALNTVRKNGVSCSAPTGAHVAGATDEAAVGPPAPPAPSPLPGVVNFLFMLNNELPHQDLWRKFFATAPAGTWRAFVHCQDEAACASRARWGPSVIDIPGFSMVPTTPTWYCHDLVTAMAQLLSSALAQGATEAPRAGPEKFVFVSDSTLPVKPFKELHAALVADDDSDFCLFPEHQWGSANIDGHDVRLVKHHQWVVLNRPHAELFVKEWVPVTERGVWQVWLKEGSWSGEKRRFVSPQHFYHPPSTNWCPDEWAFVATIFGALEPGTGALPGFGGGAFALEGPSSYTTQGRCRTFTFWDVADGDPFAPLAMQVHGDYNSQMSCYPKCYQRPATFGEVSAQGFSAMRHSEFLFVRKFSPGTNLASFQSVILR